MKLDFGLNRMGYLNVLVNNMNLAIVSPFPPDVTGIGQYGFHVSRALAQSGKFTHIRVLAGARAASESVDIPSSMKVVYAWQPDHLEVGLVINSYLRQQNPDLVWFNLGASVFGRSPLANLFGFLSLYHVRLSGLPTVVTLHELVELADLKTLNAPGGRLALFGARLLTNIATQADVVCLTMRRYVNWFSAQHPNLTCVHIPIGAYQTPERLSESRFPELLYFGTLAPYKGLEVLLSAYQLLLSRYPGLRLTIAGADHPRFPGYCDTLRRGYTALPGVRWLGQVPEDQIRAMFARAQIVILPYLASTGSSSVLYQAATWGRALVASDLSETRAVAEESNLEVEFFENRDAADLVRAIGSLIESPMRRYAQTQHNYNVIQRRRPEVTCHAYLQAFNLALEAHRSPNRIDIPAHFPSELA
jgi:glycosyltransferase involved in cell wall biosynthesis